MKRDYGRPVDLPPPRSRVAADYGSQVASQRRPSYRDYPAHDSGYPDMHRDTSRTAPRRGYLDDGYDRRLERPPSPSPHLSYREGRPRDYDTLSGSKRPCATTDDISPRYADTGARQSRSRLDYDYRGSASQYREAYGDRHERSCLGYSGSRSPLSIQNSHGAYSIRQDPSYGRGSLGGSDGGIYSSSYGRDYLSRGSDLPEDSHLVRVAACASIFDLLARLSGFPKFKKDGSASAMKVVQPVLKMLHDDNSEAVWVESDIAAKLVSGGRSHDMMKNSF